ncbi:MAG: right-handed parallel beta-helix repeat-containing protein [Bacteroidales bacterium]|nr:right-handed parallel beta-helix repeat-containing protein [Bacteroidales bacterium]
MHGLYDVKDFGASGDSITTDTKSIQSAIDKCNSDGGGTVLLTQGKYRSGTLYLKSNVTLHIDAGAVLLGSTNIGDYTTDTYKMMYKNEARMDRCLIFAKDATSIAIEGFGEINGQGFPVNFPIERPLILRLLNCKNIRLENVKLTNPTAWTSAWLYCSDIMVEGIHISSMANYNGDGLDFDGCQNVRVSNCSFDTSDDAICLQTSEPDIPCRNVVINNCIFHSKWAGIRIGLLSRGDIESVTVNNCIFRDIEDSGLKIQMNEGAMMKNMIFSNLIMKNVLHPISMTHCQQRACVDAPEELLPMKTMKGFIFENILAESDTCEKNSVIIISGMPGSPIEDITFSNIRMTNSGGGTAEDAARRTLDEFTPEVLKGWWPEVSLIGTVPAYGIYARHIKGLTIKDVSLFTSGIELRPAIVLDDVSSAGISEVQANGYGISESVFRFQNVKETTVRNCSALKPADIFIQAEGAETKDISISRNNYYPGKRAFTLIRNVSGKTVKKVRF